MTLLINDVINMDGASLRIIAISGGKVALCPMDKSSANLQYCSVPDLENWMREGRSKSVTDPYPAQSMLNPPPDSPAAKKAMANYELLRPIVDDMDCVFSNKTRSNRMNEIVSRIAGADKSKQVSCRRQIYRLLITYWQKGQGWTALLPNYGTGRGQRYECKRKPGRRGAAGAGVPITAEIRSLFRKNIKQHVLKPGGLSLHDSYSGFVNFFKDKFKIEDINKVPSFYQFKYFYYSEFNAKERARRRHSDIEYRKDISPKLGSVYDIAKGIGDIYEIDSTQADCFIIDEHGHVLGRPTVYCVIDVYSGLIAGIHAALNAPQYKVAADALYIAFSDKKEQCEKYGVPYKPDEWPAIGIPSSIKADNAELLGPRIEMLQKAYRVNIINTASYRGDQKGSVEQSFGELQARIKSATDSMPSKYRLRKEGKVDTRPMANLTFNEYYALLLHSACIVNLRFRRKVPYDWPASKPVIPLSIWKYCLLSGSSFIKNVTDYRHLRISLLPTYPISINPAKGIKVTGNTTLWYSSAILDQAGAFERGRRNAANIDTSNMCMAIDPSNISTGYLFTDLLHHPMEYHECRLAGESGHLENMTMTEAGEYGKEAASVRAKARLEAENKIAEHVRCIDEIAGRARRRRDEQGLSKREKISDPSGYMYNASNQQEKANPRVTPADEQEHVIMSDDAGEKTKQGSSNDYFPEVEDIPD